MLRKLTFAFFVMAFAFTADAKSKRGTKSFSVCAPNFIGKSDTASFSAGVDLFTCNGNLPTTEKVGSWAEVCGIGTRTGGENGRYLCTSQFTINHCVIVRTGEGQLDPFTVFRNAVFLVNDFEGSCDIEASNIKDLEAIINPGTSVRLNFNLKKRAKVPV